MKTINLTITDCYKGNANFKGSLYQFNLNNEYSIIGGWLNSPSDTDRGQSVEVYKVLTESEYSELKIIIENYKINTLTHYQPYNDTAKFNKYASKKELKAINDAAMANYQIQYLFCEKYNSKLKKTASLKIWQLHFKNYCKLSDFRKIFFW